MIKHKFTLTANGKPVSTKEDASYKAFRDSQKALDRQLWQHVWQQVHSASLGQKGSIKISLSWECTWNGRAPKRAPDVIAAEKVRRAAKVQARKEREAKWEEERQRRIVNLRKRVKSQVDHAFVTGKSGTEPASKYITCEHCDAPAAFLHLSQSLSPGAAVLDEDTIIGAACAEHGNAWGNRNYEKIPCARLEFFYDGVRQIAIKSIPAPDRMPTMKQMDEYRKKIAVFTQQLPAKPGLGSMQRMRTFTTKMMDGVMPQHMTVMQWEKFFTWLDDYVACNGVKALIAYINNALGDL